MHTLPQRVCHVTCPCLISTCVTSRYLSRMPRMPVAELRYLSRMPRMPLTETNARAIITDLQLQTSRLPPIKRAPQQSTNI